MLHIFLIALSFTSFTLSLEQHENFLSNDFTNSINARQTYFVAGRNLNDDPKSLMAIKKMVNNVYPVKMAYNNIDDNYIDDNVTKLPEHFDAREQWPKCASIAQIWDQGVCASGWAISAASVLTDRICIQKNQSENPILSAEDLLSCCSRCSFGCDGGWSIFAWEYLNKTGVTTGGTYGSNVGCKSYSLSPCSHLNSSSSKYISCSTAGPACVAPCVKTCDANSTAKYDDNIYYAQQAYRVYPTERQIKLEIFKNGPVQANIVVYDDFINYKKGVYNANETSSKYLGDQPVKIIGWGADDKNQAYWLAVNSWNEEWGDGGLFKWLINGTSSSMESEVYAALPRLT